jgi:hypothetical protein
VGRQLVLAFVGSFHKNSVKRLLEQREVAPLPPVDGQLKLNLPSVTIKRDLSCYAFKGSEVGALLSKNEKITRFLVE